MYLIDTNVISESRKGSKANTGVRQFFESIKQEDSPVYISVITIGELRRGIEIIRHRGDMKQAEMLDIWLQTILSEYSDHILNFTSDEAQVWGSLRVPHYENALDKQIAATALIYDLTLVTRNTKDFIKTGIKLFNPFD